MAGVPTRAEEHDALVQQLKDKVPLVQGRVHSSRATPLQVGTERQTLPAILVYTLSEDRQAKAGKRNGPPNFDTTLTLGVYVRVAAKNEDAAKRISDAICGEIDEAVLQDPDFVNARFITVEPDA
jgi:hypothetical protein